MPEVILPCPACGSDDVAKAHSSLEFWEFCVKCLITGPVGFSESAAIASWNRLPRTPTWTTEPPKVPGWYWWRWAKYQGWMCLAVRDGLIVEHPRKVLRHAQDIGGQWAGPIAPPGEVAKNAYCK